MKVRLFVLLTLTATAGFAAYTYELNGELVMMSDTTYAYQNGSRSWSIVNSHYVASFPSSGSMIWKAAVSGANSNDYEVTSTLALGTGGGTYVHYLRASSNALASSGSCAGSYVSVEIAVPATYVLSAANPAAAQLNINQCASGSATTLGSGTVTIPGDAQVRSVVWGTTLWVFVNNRRVWTQSVPSTTGQPGFGGYSLSAPGAITEGFIGHRDTIAPSAPVATGLRSSILPNQASLAWDGATDDSNGIGVFGYSVSRNGTSLGIFTGAELGDSTVAASTSYTYAVSAIDFHGNTSSATSWTVATPPSGAVDPRRVGIYGTGSYWGGGGEQIDTLSGNLSFSLPIATAQGRPGWNFPLNLNYNSQNWRQDSGANWQLGSDVGYGYGWKLQLGSITPYYLAWPNGVDHYVFTDSTGAEYRLDQNSGGVWSSTQGIYVWFDAGTNILHFKDGSFWLMGATSSGDEGDAGALYPTIIEDVHGNQVIASYQNAPSIPWGANTSGRITSIQDVRPAPAWHTTTWTFYYNTDPIPHLTQVDGPASGYSSTFTLSYSSAALGPPFGTDPAYSGLTTTHLASITPTASGGPYQFTYDSAGAAELTQAVFPWGGHLRWDYSTANYAGARSLREISNRYLAADSAGLTEWTYPITHSDSGTTITTVHADTTLADASGIGSKKWAFATSGSGWQVGLASDFWQKTSVSGSVLTHDTYTWSQSSSSNPYISTKISVTDEGTANAQTAKSTQTLDAYGNATQAVVYPYNDTVNPLRTFDIEYITDSGYLANYIRNRPLRTRLTLPGSIVKTLSENYYDGKTFGYQTATPSVYSTACYSVSPLTTPATATAPTTQIDANPLAFTSRGIPLINTTLAGLSCGKYFSWGAISLSADNAGNTATSSLSSTTNYSAPDSITTPTYSTALQYNSWIGLTQTTGFNGETMSMSYDTSGRPATATLPYGAVTTYAYSGSGVLPVWQTQTGPDGYTKTTLDGLGRTIKVERGPNSTTIQSEVDSVYSPCACSPLAKLQKTSMPYAPGGSPVWTSYTYDGIGRTLTKTLPDAASTTAYAYSGNQTTVTDPAGKWKTMTSDVLGNLTTVTEPDPAAPTTSTFTTSYAYDWMNHLYTTTMTRSGTTQTRTFVYNDAGQLTSATNPESGTVTYTYNGNNTLQKKHDAKGLDTLYTYDAAKRITMVQHGTTSGGTFTESTCERVTYTYDTNLINPFFSNNAWGRLTTAHYGDPAPYGGDCGIGGIYTEMYSYNAPGGVVTKRLLGQRPSEDDIDFEWYYPDLSSTLYESGTYALDVSYAYDSAGRRNSVTYPAQNVSFTDGSLPCCFPVAGPVTYTTTYDSMGRPSGMSDSLSTTWISSVSYDLAGRMTLLGNTSQSRTMSYNVNGQLASLALGASYPNPGGTLTYSYSATQNNGQITQVTDTLGGETMVYQYDALKRLTSAAATPVSGTTPTAWTQTFSYDGFGNLTGKVLNGTTTSIAVDAATNRLTSGGYDGNGNFGGAGAYYYDSSNRLMGGTWFGVPINYGYDPQNERIYQNMGGWYDHPGQLTLYGAYGEKLGTYGFIGPYDSTHGSGPVSYLLTMLSSAPVFNGKAMNATLFQDRVGNDRWGGARYRPYGEEITSTTNDRVKFATYTRDSLTGLDYADQRYYTSQYGRYNTVDRGRMHLSSPNSLDRYAYANGDPINRNDPSGNDSQDVSCFSMYMYLVYAGGLSGTDAENALSNCTNVNGIDYGTETPLITVTVTAVSDPNPDPCYDPGNAYGCGGNPGGDPGTDTDGGGTGGSGDSPVVNLFIGIPTALTNLRTFTTQPDSPCATDLGKIGLTVQQIQQFAGANGLAGAATFVGADGARLDFMNRHNADFLGATKSTTIYYNQAQAWQTNLNQLEATLIHEFSHSAGQDDVTDMRNLGILPAGWKPNMPLNTRPISNKLANDCF